MRQLIFSLALALLLPHSLNAQPTSNSANQREVIAEGIGVDVQSAAQNAAFNAMTSVVGSFIDANKILERKSEIEDGIRSESRRLTVNIREYSQGSIKAFEVLEAGQQGALFRVKAKVIVSTEEFQAFVRKLAEAESTIGTELKTRLGTASAQAGSAASIIHDNILVPILSGEVLRIEIGALVPASDLTKEISGSNLLKKHGTTSVAGARIKIGLDPQFANNLERTLGSISVEGHLPQDGGNPDGHLRIAAIGRTFTVRDIVPQLNSRSPAFRWVQSRPVPNGPYARERLTIEIHDQKGAVLRRAAFSPTVRKSGLAYVTQSDGFELISQRESKVDSDLRFPAAWSMVGYRSYSGPKTPPFLMIRESISLTVLFAFDSDTLSKAAKLVVKIAQ